MEQENINQENSSKESSLRTNLQNDRSETKSALSKLNTKKRKKMLVPILYIILGVILVFCDTFFDKYFGQTYESFPMFQIIGGILLITGILAFMFLYIMRNPEEFELKERLINIDEELELLDYDDMEYEKRAEKQFKQHQKELKRYYDVNIEHLKLVFSLGIIIMIFGVVIIIMTIYLCKDMLSSIPIIIGCISGLFVDLIGAIFIKMYVETVKASTEFHNKLIGSNNNLFANVLITKINDEKLKNETFAEIAKIISSTNSSELKTLK